MVEPRRCKPCELNTAQEALTEACRQDSSGMKCGEVLSGPLTEVNLASAAARLEERAKDSDTRLVARAVKRLLSAK